MFNAKCNTCNEQLEYKSKKAANAAARAGRRCKPCKVKKGLFARGQGDALLAVRISLTLGRVTSRRQGR